MKSFFAELHRILNALPLANAGNLETLNKLLDQHQIPKQKINEVASQLPGKGRPVPVRLQIVK